MIIEWLFLILAVSGAGLIWCLPFVLWFIYYYDTKTNKLKEKNMKSEQIKHSLSVGIKSIQSRVFDRETDEVISFVKIPIKDSGLVRCEWIELTDEEIHRLADKHLQTKNHDGALIVLGLEDFAKALMEKMRNE